MPSELPAINRIAVAAHPKIAAASKVARQIEAYLLDRGKAVSVGFIGGHELNEKAAAGKFDIWICLGGDGSMLRSGHVCGPNRLPVLGINLGTVGFLTSVQQDKWSVGLDQLLEGQFSLERRMMLKAWRIHAGKPSSTWHVLNEVTVGRGYAMRPVRLSTHVDDQYLTTYTADGLIAATATGSTAYALAAGGPVLPPELRNILIVPVAPHLSFDRAIVLAEGAEVTIRVKTDHAAALSLDGQPSIALRDGDEIGIAASEHSVKFVRLQNSGYFYNNLTSHMNSNYAS